MLLCVFFAVVHIFLLTEQCGKLNETQLYNLEKITALDEYPWLGLVFYEYNYQNQFRCLAVLISKRQAILPAHCIRNEAISLLFGRRRVDNKIRVAECKFSQECALYNITEFALHPDYRLPENNIAVATMDQDVILSDLVQPICLPPAVEPNPNYVTQRLELVSYPYVSNEHCADDRRKEQVQIFSQAYCANKFKSLDFRPASNQICGFVSSNCSMTSGAALMGVNMINERPTNFYLIGIATLGALRKNPDTPDVFTLIKPYSDWILRNTA